MKKIFFINSRLSNGGSERVMTILANYFSNIENYDVHMILIREKNEETYELNPNIKVHQLNYGTKNKILILLKRIFQLRKIFKEQKPDVIISFMIDINIVTLCAGYKERKKIIVSERADPQSNTRKKIQKKLEKILYPKCKKVVLQTDDVKKYYDKIKVFNTEVIPNPINENILNPYEGEREKRLIAAGRLTEQKNFELLIRAFKRFADIYSEYLLEICGEGPLKSDLEQLVKNENIEDKVLFSGYVKNVNERMRNATMYVSSSNFEGISNSMLEALAMGVPTISTDCPVGGAKMVIENGVNGILIPVGDEDALVNSMLKIVEDTEFAQQLSQKSILIKEKYSIEKIAKQWEKLF
ncbi:MAG: glycosyltransferase family 4 protein [Clostridia bacterium]|nr:glycosyltransferase family 4 protein [Clostridia bacterium]